MNENNHHEFERYAAEAALRWSGWGSPIGIAIVIAALGFFVMCLHWAGIV